MQHHPEKRDEVSTALGTMVARANAQAAMADWFRISSFLERCSSLKKDDSLKGTADSRVWIGGAGGIRLTNAVLGDVLADFPQILARCCPSTTLRMTRLRSSSFDCAQDDTTALFVLRLRSG